MELLTDGKKHPISWSSGNLRHTQLILQKDIKTEVSCDQSVSIYLLCVDRISCWRPRLCFQKRLKELCTRSHVFITGANSVPTSARCSYWMDHPKHFVTSSSQINQAIACIFYLLNSLYSFYSHGSGWLGAWHVPGKVLRVLILSFIDAHDTTG